MQEWGNKVLDIIRNFHPDTNTDFLKAHKGDVKDTLSFEDTPLAVKASNNLSTSVEPSQLIDPLIILSSEAVASAKLAIDPTDAPLFSEASGPFRDNAPVNQHDLTSENLQSSVVD